MQRHEPFVGSADPSQIRAREADGIWPVPTLLGHTVAGGGSRGASIRTKSNCIDVVKMKIRSGRRVGMPSTANFHLQAVRTRTTPATTHCPCIHSEKVKYCIFNPRRLNMAYSTRERCPGKGNLSINIWKLESALARATYQ